MQLSLTYLSIYVGEEKERKRRIKENQEKLIKNTAVIRGKLKHLLLCVFLECVRFYLLKIVRWIQR